MAQDSKTTVARAVVKTKPTLKAKVFPKGKALKSKKTQARIKVKLRSEAGVAGPRAGSRSASPVASTTSRSRTASAKIKLRTFRRPGKYRVVVKFKANDTFQSVRQTFKVRVKR